MNENNTINYTDQTQSLNKYKYSDLSIKLTKQINKNIKKTNGIYFTPPECIKHNLQRLDEYIKKAKYVLEPSCGSGEYLLGLQIYNNLEIDAIEYNKTIWDNIVNEYSNINIQNIDYLEYIPNKQYDLIIGNPPFYVLQKNKINKKYHNYATGRPNIFILFIIKSLEHLADNGILSFILPKSFLNCVYYDATRKYILNTCLIIDIINCESYNYLDTKQETVIFIIQKKDKSDTVEHMSDLFVKQIHTFTLFFENKACIKMNELLENSTTLKQLGFNVSVGNVVWNQCKTILTNDDTKTRLIYSTDIINNQLSKINYKNKDKLNYINKKGLTEPIIVVNRGYGVGKYNFIYGLIDISTEYLVENHLMCIKYIADKPITNEELIYKYNAIIKSFNDNRTIEFINLYFGNNAINTTELLNILPIYEEI
jgi:tRNA1(Val) A37 N6-methylase TrmN6